MSLSSCRWQSPPLPPSGVNALGSRALGTDIGAHPELGTVPGAEAGREARKTCPCVEDAYTETCRFSTGHKRDHRGEGTPNSTRSEV